MTKETHNIEIYYVEARTLSRHMLIVRHEKDTDKGYMVWGIELHFFDKHLKATGEYLLSDAINNIREVIEPMQYRMLIKGADYDATHSGMQADATAGTYVYKLEKLDQLRNDASAQPPYEEAVFHVLEASSPEDVVTLEEQQSFKKNYFKNR